MTKIILVISNTLVLLFIDLWKNPIRISLSDKLIFELQMFFGVRLWGTLDCKKRLEFNEATVDLIWTKNQKVHQLENLELVKTKSNEIKHLCHLWPMHLLLFWWVMRCLGRFVHVLGSLLRNLINKTHLVILRPRAMTFFG